MVSSKHQECYEKLHGHIKSLIAKKIMLAQEEKKDEVRIYSDDILHVLEEAFPNRPSFHHMLNGFMTGYLEREMFSLNKKINVLQQDKNYIITFNI